MPVCFLTSGAFAFMRQGCVFAAVDLSEKKFQTKTSFVHTSWKCETFRRSGDSVLLHVWRQCLDWENFRRMLECSGSCDHGSCGVLHSCPCLEGERKLSFMDVRLVHMSLGFRTGNTCLSNFWGVCPFLVQSSGTCSLLNKFRVAPFPWYLAWIIRPWKPYFAQRVGKCSHHRT